VVGCVEMIRTLAPKEYSFGSNGLVMLVDWEYSFWLSQHE